jgi:hypothetical protein
VNPSRLRSLGAAAASAALLLALAACASSPATSPSASTTPSASAAAGGPCAGVTVIVDPGALKVPASAKKTACVGTDATITAAEAFKSAGVTTEGTQQYGDQVVCRVNGIPAADLAIPAKDGSTYHEECKGMPASFAYWALWTKPADGEWAYAQEGVATQKVGPGQSIELLFTLDGKPAAPTT